MRRALHFTLAMLGVVLWLLIVAQSWVLVMLSVLGHRIWPDADRGNCWTYALPRWRDGGGALIVTMRRAGGLRIPHAAWRRPDGGIEQTEPIRRRRTLRALWGGLATLYFRYRVER